MRAKIQYDFTSMNDFFNNFTTPDEMMMDLAEVVMNYAISHDPNNTDSFKRDIGTVYVLYQEIKKLKEQQIA